ncbi:unnamed protein product [Nezara viridula]|uniref:Uncharacterized protein n=1 Tax=Nezara viridula TaxID=85310 RepID=A0A9P0HQU6_NEZVI|nr:unnamed protein product [Nezara viridula]CAH1406144.1 unnamed protein product [Nezara viridula]
MTKTQKPKTLTTKKRTPAFVKLSKSDKPEPPKKEIREKPTLQPIPIQVTASNETASRTTTNSPRNQEKPCIISKPPPIHVKSKPEQMNNPPLLEPKIVLNPLMPIHYNAKRMMKLLH